MNVNFHSMDDTDFPFEQEVNNIPALELVADADNAVWYGFLVAQTQPFEAIRNQKIAQRIPVPSLKIPLQSSSFHPLYW